VVFTVAARPGW